MLLRHGEVEAVLAVVNQIPDDPASRKRFHSRVRNLQRVGVRGRSVGPGRRATMSGADLLKLAFAVRLTQQGHTPELAALFTKHSWPAVGGALVAAYRDTLAGNRQPRWLWNEAAALSGAYDGNLAARARFVPISAAEAAMRMTNPVEAMAHPFPTYLNMAALLFRVEQAMTTLGLPVENLHAELAAQWGATEDDVS